MAAERLKYDDNSKYVSGGVTNDANLFPTMFRVDPITKRLLVDAGSITTSSASDGVTGAAVPASASYDGVSDGANLIGVIGAKNALNSTGGGIPTAQIIGQFDDVAPTAITENQFGNIRMSTNRNLYITLRDAAGNERGLNIDASGQIAITIASGQTVALAAGAAVIGHVIADTGSTTAVTGTVTVDSELPAAATIAADAVTPTVPGVASYGFIKTTAANTWDRIQPIQNATNSVGTGIMAAGLVGQFDDVSPTAITENQFGNIRMSTNRNLYGTIRDAAGNERGLNISANNAALVEGTTAHGSSDAGSPEKIGGYATNANRTRVSNAQRTDIITDLAGRPVTILGAVRELRSKQTTTISASTSETTIGTAVASVFLDLVALVVSNTSASTNTRIDFRDTTAGTILFSLQSPGNSVVGFVLPGTAIPQTSVNTNWTAQCGTSTTDIRVLGIFERNI